MVCHHELLAISGHPGTRSINILVYLPLLYVAVFISSFTMKSVVLLFKVQSQTILQGDFLY